MISKLLSFKSIALLSLTMLFMAATVAQNNEPVKVKKNELENIKLMGKDEITYQWVSNTGEIQKMPADVVITSTNLAPTEADPYGKPSQSSEVKVMRLPCNTISNETLIIDDSTPYYTVNEMPEYIDGKGELPFQISKEAKYPVEARKDKAQGIVIVQVIVEKNGSVSNPKVINSIHPKLDAEALRVIGTLKNFNPGKHNGEPVRCYYNIPVAFVLK